MSCHIWLLCPIRYLGLMLQCDFENDPQHLPVCCVNPGIRHTFSSPSSQTGNRFQHRVFTAVQRAADDTHTHVLQNQPLISASPSFLSQLARWICCVSYYLQFTIGQWLPRGADTSIRLTPRGEGRWGDDQGERLTARDGSGLSLAIRGCLGGGTAYGSGDNV